MSDTTLSEVLVVSVLGFSIAGLFLWWQKKQETKTSSSEAPTAPTSTTPLVSPLASRLLQVALNYLPESKSRISEPDPRWDKILGGRTSADSWKYYSRNFGTTCGVVAASWLEEAGGPPDMINRDPPGGSGFKNGWHIIKIMEGAKKLGWFRKPTNGQLPDLQPGDFYGSNHPAKDKKTGAVIDGTHIGTVLSVDRSGDTMTIETADGGQGDWIHQSAARRKRTLFISKGATPYIDGTLIPAGAVVLTTPGVGNAKLDWWIRNGGDNVS